MIRGGRRASVAVRHRIPGGGGPPPSKNKCQVIFRKLQLPSVRDLKGNAPNCARKEYYRKIRLVGLQHVSIQALTNIQPERGAV